MAASPQVVTANPLFLNARNNVYTAQDLRRVISEVMGAGVAGYEDFRVRQRAAGANMSVDITTASAQNVAYVRGLSVNDQGLYRVYYDAAAVLNVDIATADATNPRLDQVFLAIEDAQHAGANNQATVRTVTGTPNVGTTLDTRTGAGAAPAGMSSTLLADILVGAGVTSIANAVIRDRRAFPTRGVIPPLLTDLNMVAFDPAPPLRIDATNLYDHNTMDTLQSAALMFLPRRIVGATRIRWAYVHGATANTGNYNIGIYDASGTLIVATGATAFTGAANTYQERSEVIAATTFEAGWYYVAFGWDSATAGGTSGFRGVHFGANGSTAPPPPYRNIGLRAASGGIGLPNSLLTTFADAGGFVATTTTPGVPMVALSVG